MPALLERVGQQGNQALRLDHDIGVVVGRVVDQRDRHQGEGEGAQGPRRVDALPAPEGRPDLRPSAPHHEAHDQHEGAQEDCGEGRQPDGAERRDAERA